MPITPSVTLRSPIVFNKLQPANKSTIPASTQQQASAPQQAPEKLSVTHAEANTRSAATANNLRNMLPPASKGQPAQPKDASKPVDTKTPPVDGDGNKDGKGKFSLSSLSTEEKVAGAVGAATTGMTAFSMVSGAATQAQMMAIQEQEKGHMVENSKQKSEVAGVTRDADLFNLVTQIGK